MQANPRPRRRKAARDSQTSLGTVVLTLLAGALLTVTTGMVALTKLEQFGPAVGNILVIRPDAEARDRWTVDATVIGGLTSGLPDEATGRRCALAPGVMARTGGSLVIEARRLSRPPLYRVHWSGGHTEEGRADCGTTADLILERIALMRLTNAVGGFGRGLSLIGP